MSNLFPDDGKKKRLDSAGSLLAGTMQKDWGAHAPPLPQLRERPRRKLAARVRNEAKTWFAPSGLGYWADGTQGVAGSPTRRPPFSQPPPRWAGMLPGLWPFGGCVAPKRVYKGLHEACRIQPLAAKQSFLRSIAFRSPLLLAAAAATLSGSPAFAGLASRFARVRNEAKFGSPLQGLDIGRMGPRALLARPPADLPFPSRRLAGLVCYRAFGPSAAPWRQSVCRRASTRRAEPSPLPRSRASPAQSRSEAPSCWRLPPPPYRAVPHARGWPLARVRNENYEREWRFQRTTFLTLPSDCCQSEWHDDWFSRASQ